MSSRVLVIALAFVVAVVQASRGAWIESAGLVGLGSGLLILRRRPTQSRLRWLAWAAFAVTAAAIGLVALRARG